MTKFLDQARMVDDHRQLHPDATDEADTCWSNRRQACARNVRWRLDYHLATSALANLAQRASIYKEDKFSDHAPLTIDYDFHL